MIFVEPRKHVHRKRRSRNISFVSHLFHSDPNFNCMNLARFQFRTYFCPPIFSRNCKQRQTAAIFATGSYHTHLSQLIRLRSSRSTFLSSLSLSLSPLDPFAMPPAFALSLFPSPRLIPSRHTRRRPPLCTASQPPEDPSGGDSLFLPADWRNFRASLVRSEAASVNAAAVPQSFWAHRVPRPEEGCVLVARPSDVVSSGFFNRSVVLVISHNAEGTYGLTLNKPMGGLSSVAADPSTPIGEAFKIAKAECFVENDLLNGGPVNEGSMLLLHSKKLASASMVMDGVYCGGLLGAIVACRSGELSARECRFFSGYAAWEGGQLDRELERGCWDLAATSKDYILDYRLPRDNGDCMWRSIMNQIGERDR